MNEIKYIHTEKAAQPLGHYSQATVHNGTVYVSTQLGIDPKLGVVSEIGTITEQAEQVLKNISEI